MSRPTGPVRPLIALGLVAILATVAAAALPLRSVAAAAPLLAAKAKSAPAAAKSTELPDTVLARVGDSREITVAGFHHAWGEVKPPVRPDSLTPEAARQFLDLMIGKEALGMEALRGSWVWTAKESAQYAGLKDRMTMAMVLDSALKVTQKQHLAEGGDSLSSQELGTLARDEAIRRMKIDYREDLLQRLAKAWRDIPKPPRDSGVFAALRAMGRDPKIGEPDLHRVLASVDGRPYRVDELMDYWKHLNPITRPRIESAPQVRDLVANALYEDLLRRHAAEQGYADHPDIVAQLAKQRELIAVTHLVDRDVYQKIPLDSLTLTNYYLDHERAWDLPPRVRLLTLVLDTRAQAESVLTKLEDPAQVDSLTKQAEKVGLSFHAEYSAETDSTIYNRGMALGEGGVMGPDSTSRGWAVSRVVAILNGRPRPFSEVRELVRHQIYGEEGERLMRELLDRARSKTTVVVNDAAIRRLAR